MHPTALLFKSLGTRGKIFIVFAVYFGPVNPFQQIVYRTIYFNILIFRYHQKVFFCKCQQNSCKSFLPQYYAVIHHSVSYAWTCLLILWWGTKLSVFTTKVSLLCMSFQSLKIMIIKVDVCRRRKLHFSQSNAQQLILNLCVPKTRPCWK